jgi:hypothetical protein
MVKRRGRAHGSADYQLHSCGRQLHESIGELKQGNVKCGLGSGVRVFIERLMLDVNSALERLQSQPTRSRNFRKSRIAEPPAYRAKTIEEMAPDNRFQSAASCWSRFLPSLVIE